MAVQMRFAQGATVGEYGRALVVAAASPVTVSAQATGATTIASWRIRCWYSSDTVQFEPVVTATGDVTPYVVATGTNASPTATFTPPAAGPYIFSVETWSDAGGTAGHAIDVRELHVSWANIGDCEPAPVIGTALKTIIDAQIAAGSGPHNNFGGSGFGWSPQARSIWSYLNTLAGTVSSVSSTASTALSTATSAASAAASASSAASTAQSTAATAQSTATSAASAASAAASAASAVAGDLATEVAAREAVTEFSVGTWDSASSTINLTANTRAGYSGEDSNITLIAGAGPFTQSATWTGTIQAGVLSTGRTVSFSGIQSEAEPPTIDASLNYRITITAISTTQLIASCRREPAQDISPPTITGAAVVNADRDALAITLSESCVGGLPAEFEIVDGPVDLSITGMTGSGSSRILELSRAVVPGESLGTLQWANSTLRDGSANYLANGSRAVTNSVAYPTLSSSTIDGAAFVATFNEAVTHTSTANWSLSIGGTPATLTYVSGSGTTQLSYTSSVAATEGQTVTVTATAPTGHASTASGLAVQAFAGASVTNNTAAGAQVLFRDDFNSLEEHWTCDQGAAGMFTVSGGLALEPTPVDYGYHVWRNSLSGVTLPADYEVEFTVQHNERHRDYWGLCLAIIPTADHTQDTGIRLWHSQDDAHWYVGGVRSFNADDVAIDVTMPASWETDQLHTICVRRSGSTITLYIDGTLSGTLTGVTTNQGVTGTQVGWCGDPYGGGFAAHRAYYEVRSLA